MLVLGEISDGRSEFGRYDVITKSFVGNVTLPDHSSAATHGLVFMVVFPFLIILLVNWSKELFLLSQ